jgi:hypothetical protein
MCLLPEFIATEYSECFNRYDESVFGSDILIQVDQCSNQNDNQCKLIRNYIEMTTKNNTNETIHLFIQSLRNNSYTRLIPFRHYCDSFWDLSTTLDELSNYCEQWICSKSQYQCPKTGQCIDPDWICDGKLGFFSIF